jgi:hypothetical protein
MYLAISARSFEVTGMCLAISGGWVSPQKVKGSGISHYTHDREMVILVGGGGGDSCIVVMVVMVDLCVCVQANGYSEPWLQTLTGQPGTR